MRSFWGSDKATMDIAFEPNACQRSPEVRGLRERLRLPVRPEIRAARRRGARAPECQLHGSPHPLYRPYPRSARSSNGPQTFVGQPLVPRWYGLWGKRLQCQQIRMNTLEYIQQQMKLVAGDSP
jgi:hypothetical protein